MFLLNSMCVLICDVISCRVWSCDTGKINVYDKIVIENKKKRLKNGNQRNLCINIHFKHGLEMEFTAC